jgi:hypothetical protein
MMSKSHITIRIVAYDRGGFSLSEETGNPDHPFEDVQSFSSIEELTGVLSGELRDWNKDAIKRRRSEFEDGNQKVIKPKRFWPQLFSRIEGSDTGT